ncbi:hypothetical protein ACQPYK_02935 [Streptosporangium sp. CA-135522]|uniref:hypothetical protein n=1 Tax=Streptosporangium sp. CA-135522 TaxID=3240072 RepID=UPI003D8A30CB
MTEEEAGQGRQLENRLVAVAGVLAPTTVIGGLLLYFGYVATYARFLYFGVEFEVVDLAPQDLVLLGVEALYVPLGLIILVVLAGVLLYLLAWPAYGDRVGRRARVVVTVAAVAVGVALTIRGIMGVVVPEIAATERPIALTPLSMAVGVLLLTAGQRLLLRALGRAPHRAERAALLLAAGVVVLSLIWATNSFAHATGRGQAVTQLERLPQRPEVILDTKEALEIVVPGVREHRLKKGKAFRYRYRGLRLLAESNGRLFLVPATWAEHHGTLVVPLDSAVRVQFVPPPPP